MVPIGKEQVRQELQFIPAQLKITNYVRYAYECPACKKDGETVIEKAPTPPPVLKHSLASPSTVAHVMYQKYVNALPRYLLQKLPSTNFNNHQETLRELMPWAEEPQKICR